jgi:hypothetical protein
MRLNKTNALLLVVTLIGMIVQSVPSTAQLKRQVQRVLLVGPFENASVPDATSILGYKFADLAKINPDHPTVDGSADQTLSLFGREDLIADRSRDYLSNNCAPLNPAADVFSAIETMAKQTSIVIINESHERSEHRGFIAEVARRLRLLGYNTLAIETLTNSPSDTPDRYLPSFIREPDLKYFTDKDGYYLSESGFGRLGRQAKTLGYRLLPYEPISDGSTQTITQDEQIAYREEGQASILAAFIQKNPMAKVLLHVGYSHAAEVPRTDGATWMAARLKAKTGINPLTISQTTCRGASERLRLSALPKDEPTGTFDLIVDHPKARFERHRSVWRKQIGDQLVDIPRSLRPQTGWRVIEARPIGEPVASVPMDRVAIRPGENIALLLPPGRYHLRIIDLPKAKKVPPRSNGA